MITDCKWLLSNLATGLEKFAVMDDHDVISYLKCDGGLFYAVSNGVVRLPHIVLIDDERVDWGLDRIQELNSELREQGHLRAGNELRLALEKFLTDVLRFQSLAEPQIINADAWLPLNQALGHSLAEIAAELQSEAERILMMVLEVRKRLPKDEPVTAGQLAKSLQKLVRGEYREPLPKEVARELAKPGAPSAVSKEDCPKLKGKTSQKWMRDAATLYFSTLEGWRTN